MDEKQRNVVIMNIEFVEKETRKERKRLLGKGVRMLFMLTMLNCCHCT
jgi:hypothetical protein